MRSKASRYSLLVIWLLILHMCASFRLYFTWFIPRTVVYLICMLFALPYLINKHDRRAFRKTGIFTSVIIILNFVYARNYNNHTDNIFILFLATAATSLLLLSFLYSKVEFKIRLYHIFDKFLKIICSISLFWWILYLFGINLPHYTSVTDSFYTHDVYYFFVIVSKYTIIVPRFCGLFLEPGHLGSTCCLLLYINQFNFKDKSNYIYLFCIIFSLSLAAYCLFVIGLTLFLLLKGKKIFKAVFTILFLIGSVSAYGIYYNQGNNIIMDQILSRLIIEDGELSGDNRTSYDFDKTYKKWQKNGNTLLGMGKEAFVGDKVRATSSYKKFFLVNGYIGVFLLLIMCYALLLNNKSKQGLGLMIVFIICNMIRDYPYYALWLFLLIIGLDKFNKESIMARRAAFFRSQNRKRIIQNEQYE